MRNAIGFLNSPKQSEGQTKQHEITQPFLFLRFFAQFCICIGFDFLHYFIFNICLINSTLNTTLTQFLSILQVASSNQLLGQSHASGLGHFAKGRVECDGTVRFVGSVDFVDDDKRWFGVELDHPVGRHDGTVQGVRYFAAANSTGVFVTEAKLTKIMPGEGGGGIGGRRANGAAAASRESLDLGEEASFSGNFHNLDDARQESSVGTANANKGRTSLSMRHRVAKSSSFAAADRPEPPPPPRAASRMSTVSRMTSFGGPGRRPRVLPEGAASEDGWQSVGAVEVNKFKKKVAKKYLDVGTSAICVHNKEMGVVRYVGRVDFAPGIWVGLEMRNPVGRHDGLVEGKRYFTARGSHGVIMRPKKISVHGINGERLLKPEHEYPF